MHTIGRIEGELGTLEKIFVREKSAASAEVVSVEFSKVKSLVERIEELCSELGSISDLGAVKSVAIKIRDSVKSFMEANKNAKAENRAADLEKEIKILREKHVVADDDSKEKESDLKKLSCEYDILQKEIEKEKDTSRDAEKALFRIVAEQNELRGRLSVLRVREDKLKLEKEDFKREIEEGVVLIGRDVYLYESDATEYQDEERHTQEERRKQLEKIKVRLEDSGGTSPNEVMKEFRETSERDEFLAREIIDLEKSAESLTTLITELATKLETLFTDGIHKINKQFGEFFALMFGGGDASLTVVEEKKRRRVSIEELSELGIDTSDDDEEENEIELGVDIKVNLPRKKIRSLEMLSGGERALTSIALLFAMSQVNPPPFIILDETDAALDEANSRKYGDMVENLARVSQLIVITHNRETMSRAGILYGVTMGKEGYSKLLSIAFNEAVVVAK